MPMRNQTQSRLSARAVYASNAMKVEGPKRGRPRKVSERFLSEDPKNIKTVVRKQQRSVGKKRNIGKVENNSSEADCSSEGEEMEYTDDESKVTGSDGEEIEEGDEGDASSELEDNSAEGEEDSAEDSAEDLEDSDEEEEDLDDEEEEDLDDEEEEEEVSDVDEDDIDEQSSFQDEDLGENETEVTDEEEADDEEADEDEVRYSLPDPKKISPAGKTKTSMKDSAKHERQKISDSNLVSKRASPKKKGEIATKNESPKRGRPKTDNKNKSEKAALTNSDKRKKEKTKTPDQSEAAEHGKQSSEDRSEEDENETLSLQNHANSDEQQNMRIKASNKNDLTPNSTKRKMRNEASDEDEDVIQQNGFTSKKHQKKIRRENQIEEDIIEENNHIVSTAPFQRLLNQAAAGTSNSKATGGRKKKRLTSYSSCLGPPLSLNKFYESVPCGNVAADEAFRYLLHPTTPEEFFKKDFENSPFHVARYRPDYYNQLFSNEDLNTMMKENNLEYGVHIDVLKYFDGQRIPVEAAGKAYYSNVWEDYKEGFSIRVRNPQAYNKNIWNLCSLLQEYFSSSVGVNIYLTPPCAQGFPPHYDDIDAFILQIEGIKHWKVYAPRNPSEDLARYSSIDFKENEIGPVLMEFSLSPGDLLYIPRGYIHQASTNDHFHSLHFTFSTNQLNTWGDLLLSATRKALEKAMLSDVHFRKAVPKDFMNYAGVTASEESIKQRAFIVKLKKLAAKAMEYLDPEEAADTHALRFIRCSLPPTFNKIEQERSIHGNGSCWKDKAVWLKPPIELDTEVRIIRKRNQRLVIDESGPKLFHNLENTRDPKDLEEEGQEGVYIDFDMEGVPAFTYLLQKHPTFVKVMDLPIVDAEDRISFATSLYENGLLMTKYPVPPLKTDLDWIGRIPDEPLIKVEKDD